MKVYVQNQEQIKAPHKTKEHEKNEMKPITYNTKNSV